MSDVRAKRRLEVMGRIQAAALDLFDARAFDRVTIEEIAAAAEVSAPTVYRHFGTKEQIVLWDEYDAALFHVLEERLRSRPLLDAVREAVFVPLNRVYTADAGRILRRARLGNKEPAIRAARDSNLGLFRTALARTFITAEACRDQLEADVIAGAVIATLQTAIDHWSAADGKEPLRRFIQRAFRHLRGVGARAKTRVKK